MQLRIQDSLLNSPRRPCLPWGRVKGNILDKLGMAQEGIRGGGGDAEEKDSLDWMQSITG